MISLIINADDLGSNTDRDRGILEAFQQGIVTSASLLANGASFDTAVDHVKASGLPVGIHLNLADGLALKGQIKGLTNTEGRLPGKQILRQCLAAGACDRVAIRDELAAQIKRVFNAGLKPDHIDSHQHCQIFPCVATMITELALEYDIQSMRTTRPVEPVKKDPDDLIGKELALYRQLGKDAHATIINAGMKTTDGLWGLPLLNRLNTSSLCRLLEKIPNGSWELMTHPGYPCDHSGPFNGPERQVELQALLSTAAKEIIARRQIRLSTFGELACAF